jgi:dTDP-4-amino-4,6-dideoxygalactose transaminase
VFNAPQPRSYLYTSFSDYAKGSVAALTGIGYEGSGPAELEKRLAAFYPGHRIIALPMARVGIYLAIKHTIKPGQKVILSPYTITDVVNMVLCAGGVPLFADIEEGGSCNIDADDVVALLDEHKDVGAVMVTHFYGLVCNIMPIADACKRKGIPLIEDSAQCFDGKLDGKPAGTIGDVGVLSFGLLKNVVGFFGGALIVKDAALEAKVRQELERFSIFPRKALIKKMITGATYDIATNPLVFGAFVYWVFRYAYLHDLDFFNNKLDTDSNPVAYSKFPDKYAHRMSSVQAEIASGHLVGFEEGTAERIAKAKMYHEGLSDIPGLVLPPLRTDGSHIYMYYPIQYEDRDGLVRAITRDLRDLQISHHRNCAGLECFSEYFRDCPNAERASRNVIYLPTYPGYRDDQVRANIEAIRAYFRRANRPN